MQFSNHGADMPLQLSPVEGEIARVRRHCGFRQSADEDGVAGTDRDGGSRTAERRRHQELSKTVLNAPPGSERVSALGPVR